MTVGIAEKLRTETGEKAQKTQKMLGKFRGQRGLKRLIPPRGSRVDQVKRKHEIEAKRRDGTKIIVAISDQVIQDELDSPGKMPTITDLNRNSLI